MAPAQKDTLRKLQAEAYLSVLRAVAASELDWVRTFDEERQGERTRGTRCIVFSSRRSPLADGSPSLPASTFAERLARALFALLSTL